MRLAPAAPSATDGAIVPFAAVPHALLTDQRLPPSAKLLAGVILRFARQRDHAWPSLRTLGALLQRGRRSIQLNLGRLKQAGWIAEEPAENPTGRILVLLWRRTGAVPTLPTTPALPTGSDEGEPRPASARPTSQRRSAPAPRPTIADPASAVGGPTPAEAPVGPPITPEAPPAPTPRAAAPVVGPTSTPATLATPTPPALATPKLGGPVASPPGPSVQAQVVAPPPVPAVAPPPAQVVAPKATVLEEDRKEEDAADRARQRPRRASLATAEGLAAALQERDDPILQRELARRQAPSPPPAPAPTTIGELITRVRERPHHPMLLADWLAASLNDRRSYRGYLAKVQQLVAGQIAPETIADALRQATKPGIRRPGALFMTVLRRAAT